MPIRERMSFTVHFSGFLRGRQLASKVAPLGLHRHLSSMDAPFPLRSAATADRLRTSTGDP
jgi:hypothetical protein